jgi:hypothetical protein
MLKLLFNYAGDQVSEITYAGTAPFYPGYDENLIVAGNRNTRLRTYGDVNPKIIAYKDTSSRSFQYLVVTRADYGITQAGQNMYSYRNPADYTALLTPITKDDLMGPYDQDYCVKAWSSGSSTQHGIEYRQVSGVEPMQINQLCVAEDFDLGIEPSFASSWDFLQESQRYFTPLKSQIRLRTEARMKMVWVGVAKSDYDALMSWPHLMRWPFFLYDENADIIPWKLEHVCCEQLNISIGNNGRRNIEMTLRRLEHYE